MHRSLTHLEFKQFQGPFAGGGYVNGLKQQGRKGSTTHSPPPPAKVVSGPCSCCERAEPGLWEDIL